jgi:hypothetical protein
VAGTPEREGSAADLRLTSASTCSRRNRARRRGAAWGQGHARSGRRREPRRSVRCGRSCAAFLVLDEREQGRDDDGHARDEDGRQLVAQGLAAA